MFTNIYMKIFYLQQNFWKYFFFQDKTWGLNQLLSWCYCIVWEIKSIHSDKRTAEDTSMEYGGALVFNYWLHILKLFKKTWNGQIKNLQPIYISIFYMVYIHIIEIWYWNNLTVRIQVGMYLLHLMIYFIQNCPAYYKQDGLMSVKTSRHIHICS